MSKSSLGWIFGISGTLVGISFSLLFFILFIDSSDSIAAIEILVNVIIGAAIVFVIQKKLTDDRGVKDHLIHDIEEVKNEYKIMVNKLFAGNMNPLYLLEWYKQMLIKIDQITHFCKSEFNVQTESMSELNRKLHKLITSSDEFNNDFSQSLFVPSNKLKNEITSEFQDFKFCLVNYIIKINRG
ncbi:MAG: hypothetical protein RJQ14_11860 [Marinoscillum sp.]